MNTQKLMFGVLTIGLLGIYILHFTGKGGTAEKNNASDTLPAPSGNLQVFYVQADSVIGNFDMMQDLDQKFRSDNSIRESKLMDAKARFERKLKEYENKAPTLTTRERGKYEEELQQMQGQLMQDNQELSQMAAMQEAQMIGQVYDSLHVYFAEIGEDLEADFILAAQKTSGVLYANPQRDITTKAIEHINARYARSQSSNQPE
jgi:Skp family chaperone for outer membrane proteins